MPRLLVVTTLVFLVSFLGACQGTPRERYQEIENGSFKILIRSREFHSSGVTNVDVCVAQASQSQFPKDKAQCFLHGFDFSGLTAKWRSQHEILVSFHNGRVTYFMNYATISNTGPTPTQFHAILCDGCDQ